jgi:hypothetical protein
MTESDALRKEIYRLAAAAEADPETTSNLKSLAVQLWANFDEFTVEDLEDILRDEWRTRGLPFNDNTDYSPQGERNSSNYAGLRPNCSTSRLLPRRGGVDFSSRPRGWVTSMNARNSLMALPLRQADLIQLVLEIVEPIAQRILRACSFLIRQFDHPAADMGNAGVASGNGLISSPVV